MEKHFLFVDTNILLHYPPLDKIDWLKHAKAKSATIVIAQVVLRELNRHKDKGTSSQLRNRAKEVLRYLVKVYQSAKPAFVRDNVELHFMNREPQIDFREYDLDRELGDDYLIASALDFLQSHKDPVTVVTDDFGLLIKSSTQLRVLQLPSEMRLPQDVDEDQKRIKQLEASLQHVSSVSPLLSLNFGEDRIHAEFNLCPSRKLTARQMEEKLAVLARTHSKIETPNGNDHVSYLIGLQYQKYNRELEHYHQEYSQYLRKVLDFEDLQRRTLRLNLEIHNQGGKQATDIDIQLKFPVSVRALEDTQSFACPNEPAPPPRPDHRLIGIVGEKTEADRFTLDIPNQLTHPLVPTSATARWQRLGECVELHLSKLKHHGTCELPPLTLLFDSFESVRSFSFEFKVSAEGIQKPCQGTLSIVVRSEPQNSPNCEHP